MLEMPVLAMSTSAVYCLYAGTEKGKPAALFGATLLAALAFLTKQSAVFLVALWFGWIILMRRWDRVKSKYFLVGGVLGTLILMPWLIINLTIGRGHLFALDFEVAHIMPSATYYVTHLSELVSYPIIILCVGSILWFRRLRESDGYTFTLLWGCSVLLFLLPMKYTEPRYGICLVPVLIILSMQVISFAIRRWRFFSGHKNLCIMMVSLLVGIQVHPERVWGGPDIRGFGRVADFVVSDSDCVSVLYDGYFNGNFVFHMRARDKERRVFVFRASKIIFSTNIILEWGYNELVKDVSGLYELLDRYSIKYIIQEERDRLKTEGNRKLREWVKGRKFTIVGKYPVHNPRLGGPGSLLVYRYSDYVSEPVREIELDMPALGRRISVKIGKGTPAPSRTHQ
jgi:hypothetical protein